MKKVKWIFIVFFVIFSLVVTFVNIFGETSNSQNTNTANSTIKLSKLEKALKEITKINDESIINLSGQLKDVGVETINNIEYEPFFDNEYSQGSKAYRLSIGSINNLILHIDDQGKIYDFHFVENYMYRDGEKVGHISDFTISNKEQSELQIKSQKVITSILKAPSTAEFPNILEWKFGKQDGVTIVQSYVDSQNGFGAMIRSEFQLKIQNDKVISLIFDGEEYIQ